MYLWQIEEAYMGSRLVGKVASDMGGRTDVVDRHVMDTAVREVCEESNGKLFGSKDTIAQCYEKTTAILETAYAQGTLSSVYHQQGCYLLFMVELPEWVYHLPTSRFSDTERMDNIRRYFVWSSCPPANTVLHRRLRSGYSVNYLFNHHHKDQPTNREQAEHVSELYHRMCEKRDAESQEVKRRWRRIRSKRVLENFSSRQRNELTVFA